MKLVSAVVNATKAVRTMPSFISRSLCEEVCPVKAISKDEYGVEHIDESKCIYCGKCVNACPFGAIFEISQVFDILQRLRNKEQMVAIVAPSILAQFSARRKKCMALSSPWDSRKWSRWRKAL